MEQDHCKFKLMAADLPRTATGKIISRFNDYGMAQATELVNKVYRKAIDRADFYRLINKKIDKIQMYKALFPPKDDEISHDAKRARYN